MQPSNASEGGASVFSSSFDPQVAKAKQDAERYGKINVAMLWIAAFAAVVAFLAEMGSWFNFSDWLYWHDWSSHELLKNIVHLIVGGFSLFFVVFGLFGIAALFKRNGTTMRSVLVAFGVPMLLLPVFRGEIKRLLLIAAAVGVYVISRKLAEWAQNETPRDWKIALAERKRLGWGPEEFARALTQGRASDKYFLAVLNSGGFIVGTDYPGMIVTDFDGMNAASQNTSERVDALLQREAYGELTAFVPPQYLPYTTLLKLRLHRRRDLLADPKEAQKHLKISEQECATLRETTVYIHPEIVQRLELFLDK